ncbi:MAG: VOC family protein [Deltaproteobacteria bacterium]|nr:VOC family protein [Deltaproteobacteria bacterium]MBW2390954.1 VOC family protein [Deltaproteobacteria bacterium]
MLESLDHIVIATDTLDEASRQLIAVLGRTPSWSGSHPSFGTRNVLFRLDNTYVELLAPDGEGPVADGLRARLSERGPGLHALALGTEDADEAARSLKARGLDVAGPVAGIAQDAPSGAFRRFRNVLIRPEQSRGVGLFVIEHLSEPDELPPALPVGDEAGVVSALDHVVIMTRDPDAAKQLYGDTLGIRLALDRSFEKRGVRLLFFRLGGATIEIAAQLREKTELGEAERDRDRLWGVAWQVPDAERARARIVEAGLSASQVRDGHKPGTRVFSVEGEPLGVPTLMIQPVAR